ncbi:unnamed protein product [Nippostrongylus brasiliensis]|uniref:ACB domain-containing protein n=1 Tax=Nippostrongylus brasiliensis TaxID=27835 RepID=A0A0N4XXE1_NIPBR|nr:unnamed protein product [Nippostrongylus brasiliensis]
MTFDIAAEEMRRLKNEPTDEEKLVLYGLYKQSIHGDIPPEDSYVIPTDDIKAMRKYKAWASRKDAFEWQSQLDSFMFSGQSKASAQEEYVRFAEEMIRRYHRHIHRCKWNSEVWTVDY